MIENKFLQIGLDFATSIAALGDDPAECFKSFEHVSSDFENDFPSVSVSYTHLTLPTICSV